MCTQPWAHFERDYKEKGVPMADGDEPMMALRILEEEIRAAARATSCKQGKGHASVVDEPDDMEDAVPGEPEAELEEDPRAADPGNSVPQPQAKGVPDHVRGVLQPEDDVDVAMPEAPEPATSSAADADRPGNTRGESPERASS